MACRTLLRRKTQLDLLGQACEEAIAAHIRLRGKEERWEQVKFIALERNGLVLEWVNGSLPKAGEEGRPVVVRFEYENESYIFNAVSRGCINTHDQSQIKFSVPLRIEQTRRRDQLRMSLDEMPPIIGAFTHAIDARRQFEARLTDISDGGVGVSVPASEVSRLYTGDLFWLNMSLPGEVAPAEFIVRLIHLRPIKNTNRLAMGWAFQPTDDSCNHERYLRRLEAFIARVKSPGSESK